jgi:crotonobetainyl-CoA:carnitine CoA-transferase CaiB-like acyl-CoA transferase
VALLDALLFQSDGLLTLGAYDFPMSPMGNEAGNVVPLNVYKCSDGSVFASVLLDSHWQRLAHLIGRPDVANHPNYATLLARLEHRAEVNQMLGS